MLLEKTLTMDEIKCEVPTWIHPDALLENDEVRFSDGFLECGLMEEKYEECTEEFIESLINDGQVAPCLIEKDDRGYYFMNGHHRLAVASRHNLEILVMIVSSEENIFVHWDTSESDFFPDSMENSVL